MYKNTGNEPEMVALTEQGDLGLGVHHAQNEKEREALRRKLEEMTSSINEQSSKK